MAHLLSTAVLLVALVASVSAHSWVHCTDYRMGDDPANAQTYKEDLCFGYPRLFHQVVGDNPFGLDRGLDYRPGPTCRDPLTEPITEGYSTEFPMAQYTPGQKVCFAWPPKNHVAVTCNNEYIPDNGMTIYVSGANPTADPASTSEMQVVKEFPPNSGADKYEGFQNCPLFCDDPDKSLCTGCFDVPADLTPGNTYTFVWNWAFNSPEDLYATCWEAMITDGNGAAPAPAPAPAPEPSQEAQPEPEPSQDTPPAQPSANPAPVDPAPSTQSPPPPTSSAEAAPSTQSSSSAQPAPTSTPMAEPTNMEMEKCLQLCQDVCDNAPATSCDCSNPLRPEVVCADEAAGSTQSSLVAWLGAMVLCGLFL